MYVQHSSALLASIPFLENIFLPFLSFLCCLLERAVWHCQIFSTDEDLVRSCLLYLLDAAVEWSFQWPENESNKSRMTIKLIFMNLLACWMPWIFIILNFFFINSHTIASHIHSSRGRANTLHILYDRVNIHSLWRLHTTRVVMNIFFTCKDFLWQI